MRERLRWRHGAARGDAAVFYGFDRLPRRRRCPAACEGAGFAVIISKQPAERQRSLFCQQRPSTAGRLMRAAPRRPAESCVKPEWRAYPGWHGAGWERANRPMRTC